MSKNKKRILFALILAGMIAAGSWAAAHVTLRPATGEDLPAEEPAEGIGRAPAVIRYLAQREADREETAQLLEIYVEGEGPAPAWYDPTEPMAAEWKAAEAHAPEGIAPGGIDWNLCSERVGWDGHRAEIWELDLMSRVFYLEFWQPDVTLCEAGCDAILRLWETGEKGATLGEVLSSTAENGAWTYSVYPDVWTTNYDPDGLAWCRAYCEQRFTEGPEWIAPYFRLDYYHDWAVPAYQIGNVYFSVGGGTDGEG